jgi:hypothetical protein
MFFLRQGGLQSRHGLPIPVRLLFPSSLGIEELSPVVDTRCPRRMICRSRTSKTGISGRTTPSHARSYPGMPNYKASSHQKTNRWYVLRAESQMFGGSICTQMSLFLSSLPPSATEDTVRTRVVKSIPGVDPTSLRSVVHVAKSRRVLPPSCQNSPHNRQLQMRICKLQRPRLRRGRSSSMG